MKKKKFILVHKMDTTLSACMDCVETDVSQYLEEGYVLAGPLVYQTADNPEDIDWHIAIQPMILGAIDEN